jgi:hypothetical protein
MTARALCEFCKTRPVGYEGALYCGAACCARAEAHETPPEPPKEEEHGVLHGSGTGS